MKRINIVGVPVDIVKQEELEEVLFTLYEQAGTKQIIFLSIWDLLKARRNSEYMQCLKSAALILPISKSILRGAAFLKQEVPVRYNPFSTVIMLLTYLETRYKSLYMFGGRKSSLMDSEHNIRVTYPGLQIVGRYVGYYPSGVEKDIISAIYKANPSLVIISDGVKKGETWAYEHRNEFGSSFFIYYKDIFDIFSKRKNRVDPGVFERGNEIWTEIFHNPFKLFLIFPYIWYKFLLLFYRLFRINKKTEKSVE